MRPTYSITFLLFAAALLVTSETQAQLLEDTDRRLKTSQKEGRGFLGGLFSKRGKSQPSSLSFGKTSSGKSIQPRYSRPFSFDGRAPEQRSVSFRDPFKGQRNTPKPRYSKSGSPFTPQDRVVLYWQRSENPWSNQRYKIDVKSASGIPFANRRFKSDIKSATGMPFTNKDIPVVPRASGPSPFTQKFYNPRPPYSGTTNFNLAMRNFWERFTRPSAVKDAGPVMWRQEREKYKNIAKYYGPFPEMRAKKPSPPPQHKGLGPVVWEIPKSRKPEDISDYRGPFDELKTSMNPYRKAERNINDYLGPHNGIRVSKNTYKQADSDLGEYLGPYKIKIAKVKGDLHPSHRYKQTVLMKNDFAKDGLRKWNIFWAGINPNQERPKGVKEKISKPKFDKKEREIWNN